MSYNFSEAVRFLALICVVDTPKPPFVSFLGSHKLDTISRMTARKLVAEAAAAIRTIHYDELSQARCIVN
jgi:hypothetical protein